jgi:hypothetical protein
MKNHFLKPLIGLTFLLTLVVGARVIYLQHKAQSIDHFVLQYKTSRAEQDRDKLGKCGWLVEKNFPLTRKDITRDNQATYLRKLDALVGHTPFSEPDCLRCALVLGPDSVALWVSCYSNDLPQFESIVDTFEAVKE